MDVNIRIDSSEDVFCRGCLTSSYNLKPMESYHKSFSEFSSLKVPENDPIHNWLCSECRILLFRFQTFKWKALKVDEILQKHINSTQKRLEYLKMIDNELGRNRTASHGVSILQACNECSESVRPSVIAQVDVEASTQLISTKHSTDRKTDVLICKDGETIYQDPSDDDNIQNDYIEMKIERTSNLDCKNAINNAKKIKKSARRSLRKDTTCNNSKNGIQKRRATRKHKKREWVRETLNMNQVTVLDLSPEEQMKALEDRRISKDFHNARYKCEMCVKVFPHVESLQNHMQRHDKSFGDFECSICRMRFVEKKVLKNHFGTHSRRYQCQKCERILHFKTTMATHLLRHENTYVCNTCGHRSENKESNKIHQKTHSSSETFKCSICPKILNSKHDYGVHIRRHTGDMPFKCVECGKCFQTGAMLATHKSVHSTVREFYCARCDVSFKTKDIMLTHMKKSARHVNPALLTFQCTQCPKKFKSEAQLSGHIDSYHLRCVQLFCDVCPARFVSANGLRNHRRRKHEGLLPTLSHVCETCGRGFSTKTLVTNHLRTHTGERPFECETCHRRFTQKSSLQTHIKLVHLKMKRNKSKAATSPAVDDKPQQFERRWTGQVL
ncbi:uncharacterized protein LOC143914389 [Arctopsyche grandis]|uniref:uncharacterized protein LOC143914389 n=1 Tax=Arctopsyche grandis TaxID=121162 RepID=UPI00406D7FE1